MKNLQQLICSICNQQIQQIIAMECAHHICLQCASPQIRQNNSQINQKFYILCKICNKQTQLQKSAQERIQKKQNCIYNESCVQSQTNSQQNIFCFDCMQGPFSLESFITSGHKNHQVWSINQRQKINKLIKGIRFRIKKKDSECKNLIQIMRLDYKLIQQQVDNERKKIITLFNNLRRAISESENYYLKGIQQIYKPHLKVIGQYIRQLERFACQTDLKIRQIQNKPISKILEIISKEKKQIQVMIDYECQYPMEIKESKKDIKEKIIQVFENLNKLDYIENMIQQLQYNDHPLCYNKLYKQKHCSSLNTLKQLTGNKSIKKITKVVDLQSKLKQNINKIQLKIGNVVKPKSYSSYSNKIFQAKYNNLNILLQSKNLPTPFSNKQNRYIKR